MIISQTTFKQGNSQAIIMARHDGWIAIGKVWSEDWKLSGPVYVGSLLFLIDEGGNAFNVKGLADDDDQTLELVVGRLADKFDEFYGAELEAS